MDVHWVLSLVEKMVLMTVPPIQKAWCLAANLANEKMRDFRRVDCLALLIRKASLMDEHWVDCSAATLAISIPTDSRTVHSTVQTMA